MIPPEIFDYLGRFFEWSWWWWMFMVAAPLAGQMWRAYREELFFHAFSHDSILLEIKVPREVTKSPKAMEQVLHSIHQLKNVPGDLEEWWWDGEVTIWFSLEIVSFGGEVHLYIWAYKKYRSMIEAAFFSFYPDVEIVQVPDYMDRLPRSVRELYARGYDMWGSEVVLGKSDMYPIKSYLDFESPDEEKQYDPISAVIELFGRVKPEEIVCLQYLIQPLDEGVWHHFHEELHRLQERLPESQPKSIIASLDFSQGVLPGVKEDAHGEDQSTFFRTYSRTPGEIEVLKAVESNLSDLAFECIPRFLYFSPEPTFFEGYGRRGFRGIFNQYGATDTNYFAMNWDIATRVRLWNFPYIFPKIRGEYRKARLIDTYTNRKLVPENFAGKLVSSFFFNHNFSSRPLHLSTRSVATLFHPPTRMVLTAPHIERIESKKGGPPAGLAIYGEEEHVEPYQQ